MPFNTENHRELQAVGIAVWTDLLNGLSRAALKPEAGRYFQIEFTVSMEAFS